MILWIIKIKDHLIEDHYGVEVHSGMFTNSKITTVAFRIKHMSKDIGNNESCISACWRKELEIWKGEDKNELCYNELKLKVAVWVHNF